MIKRHMELLLIALTVLALGAGVAAGLLASRLPAAAVEAPPIADATPLAAELHLTSSQQDQMREIWEAVRDEIRTSFERAQRLHRQRDQALLQILTDEQKAQFEAISREYADRFSEISSDRDQVFQSAVERTKMLLSAEQRERYDHILRSRGALPAGPSTNPGLQSLIP